MTKLESARVYEKLRQAAIKAEERPLFHVSPLTGWLNDPNGFSIYKGEYHLFYQYYPYDTKWGTMHWGHYKSADMICWEPLPAALAPDEPYETGCYSGSALERDDGAHLIMYTAHYEKEDECGNRYVAERQCIATGNGVDYTKYEGNPVLTEQDLPHGGIAHEFRDPKIWRDKDEYRCVAVNMSKDQSGQVLLYNSSDGYKWSFVTVLAASKCQYGKMWECPDFFELGEHAILLVSPMNMEKRGVEFHSGHNVIAMVGTYDDARHTFSYGSVQAVDYGFDFYATQTVETMDGRRVMIAWMQSWEVSACRPTDAKWFGMMTLPRELSIEGGRVLQNPIRELEKYRAGRVEYKDVHIEDRTSLAGIRGRTIDLSFTLHSHSSDCRIFTLYIRADEIRYTKIEVDFTKSLVTVDRENSGIVHDVVPVRDFAIRILEGKVLLRVVLDRYSAELFVNGGEQAFSMCMYDSPQDAQDILFEADAPISLDVEKYDIVI